MTRRALWLLAIVLAALVPCAGILKAQSGRLSGTVRDTNGSGLPGVSVRVTSSPGPNARTTQTDERGRFAMNDLPSGKYSVTFSLIVLEACHAGVSISTNRQTVLDIAMLVVGYPTRERASQQAGASRAAEPVRECRPWPPARK